MLLLSLTGGPLSSLSEQNIELEVRRYQGMFENDTLSLNLPFLADLANLRTTLNLDFFKKRRYT